MTRVAVVAAMAGELQPLVRGWQHESGNGVDLWRWRHDEGEWVAACAGAGVAAATRAFAEIEKDGPVSFIISTGWAGALRQEFKPGRIYHVSGVIDVRTGERFRAAGPDGCSLVTGATVADEAEKKRLGSAYNADLVDMEAAAVARLAGMRAIPFYCIKGVSDGFTGQLPDFNRFLSHDGQFRMARFVVYALLRPWHWPALIRMNENSKRAARGIAEALLDFLDERGHVRQRNGYPNHKR